MLLQTPVRTDYKFVGKSLSDLLEPNPRIYWADLALSAAAAWGSLFVASGLQLPWAAFVSLVAAIPLYRCLTFTHEITHLHASWLGHFRFVWNLLCGFACMLPTVVYEDPHQVHHSPKTFGTKADPRYMPFMGGPKAALVMPLIVFAVTPLLLAIRFAAIAPLSWIIPPLRRFAQRRLSALELNLGFERDFMSLATQKSLIVQELGCMVYIYGSIWLVTMRVIPVSLLGCFYFSLYIVFCLNHIRALAAHRYASPGDRLSFAEQISDSITIDSNRLDILLLAPVGLRFHSLHHLSPQLPYHAMPKAHQRLKNNLPANHPYFETLAPSMWQPLLVLWQSCSSIF